MFDVGCLMFDAELLMFDVGCLMWDVTETIALLRATSDFRLPSSDPNQQNLITQ